MKFRSISRLSGAYNNVQNGIYFLEVQDGVPSAAGRIVDRMIENKGSQGMMKNEFDNSPNNEFQELQCRSVTRKQTFGVSLFAFTNGGGDGVFINPNKCFSNFDNTAHLRDFRWFNWSGDIESTTIVTLAMGDDLKSSIYANRDNWCFRSLLICFNQSFRSHGFRCHFCGSF